MKPTFSEVLRQLLGLHVVRVTQTLGDRKPSCQVQSFHPFRKLGSELPGIQMSPNLKQTLYGIKELFVQDELNWREKLIIHLPDNRPLVYAVNIPHGDNKLLVTRRKAFVLGDHYAMKAFSSLIS